MRRASRFRARSPAGPAGPEAWQARGEGVDEVAVAAIGISFVIQVGAILGCVFFWQETATRTVAHEEPRTAVAGAVIAAVPGALIMGDVGSGPSSGPTAIKATDGGHARDGPIIRMAFGELRVTGGCEVEVVKRGIRWNANHFRRCCERLLQRDPQATGALQLRWTLGGDGRSKKITVNGAWADKDTRTCIATQVHHLRLEPPLEGACRIRQSLIFSVEN